VLPTVALLPNQCSSRTCRCGLARLGNGWHSAGTALAELPAKLRILRTALAQAGRAEAEFVISAFPTDRFTPELVQQFAAQGVTHVLVPVFSFERDKVLRRLEQIASEVIAPYRRSGEG
jgi:alkanesulfonate monooxygenase SsuD/methylene tetrahydromethanopterin reductase-like flavin-dependent oxidoreductase (luciferase family)